MIFRFNEVMAFLDAIWWFDDIQKARPRKLRIDPMELVRELKYGSTRFTSYINGHKRKTGALKLLEDMQGLMWREEPSIFYDYLGE